MGGGRRAVEIVSSKGCTAIFTETASSFRKHNISNLQHCPDSDHELDGPFAGLVICITGLSKETRKQVKEATEKLGGIYSTNLHSQCTHLVLQSTGFHKLDDQAIKQASAKGKLSLVTIGWFVDSVRRKVRLNEDLYSINQTGKSSRRFAEHTSSESPSLSATQSENVKDIRGSVEIIPRKTSEYALYGKCIYIDPEITPEMQIKVIEAASAEGVTFLKKWDAGCTADYIVSEGASVRQYLGQNQCNTLVTPSWILKTVKAHKAQKLINMSEDLAKQVQAMLEIRHDNNSTEDTDKYPEHGPADKPASLEMECIMNLVNDEEGHHGNQIQSCSTPMLQETPSNLLHSICWNVSDPTSSASTYADSSSTDLSGDEASIFVNANEDVKSDTTNTSSFSRPLNQIEKSELILRTRILTILFPVDRYSEMGPSSRSFFSKNGFTCLQVLDHIHSFYQENLTEEEINIAIQTDSPQAQALRSLYFSRKACMHGSMKFKRLDLLGSRKRFEMLKRTGNTHSAVYELLLGA